MAHIFAIYTNWRKSIRTGFVCGAWDLLHPGHVILLAECRKRCDALLVGLHTDPSIERSQKNKPVQSVYERYMQLAYNKSVYHVVPYETERDLENILSTMDIQVRFLGSDYEDRPFTAETVCSYRDIEIEYIDRLHDWSTTELRERIK